MYGATQQFVLVLFASSGCLLLVHSGGSVFWWITLECARHPYSNLQRKYQTYPEAAQKQILLWHHCSENGSRQIASQEIGQVEGREKASDEPRTLETPPLSAGNRSLP